MSDLAKVALLTVAMFVVMVVVIVVDMRYQERRRMGREGHIVHKQAVIQRVRQAQQWCVQHGAPYDWLRRLLVDVAQELQGESGALWLQWSLGPTAHVRVFVEGEMTLARLDSLIEVLTMQREWLVKDIAKAAAVPQDEPTEARHDE